MQRKSRQGRQTRLGGTCSAVLRLTLQRALESDCSGDGVTGAQQDQVTNNTSSKESNNNGRCSLLRPLTNQDLKALDTQ